MQALSLHAETSLIEHKVGLDPPSAQIPVAVARRERRFMMISWPPPLTREGVACKPWRETSSTKMCGARRVALLLSNAHEGWSWRTSGAWAHPSQCHLISGRGVCVCACVGQRPAAFCHDCKAVIYEHRLDPNHEGTIRELHAGCAERLALPRLSDANAT